MKVGLIIEKYNGKYYCSTSAGKEPATSPGATLIFSLLENVNSADELYKKARAEANKRGIGDVVILPS